MNEYSLAKVQLSDFINLCSLAHEHRLSTLMNISGKSNEHICIFCRMFSATSEPFRGYCYAYATPTLRYLYKGALKEH